VQCHALSQAILTSDLGAPDSGRNELFKPKIHHRDNQETETQSVLEWPSCLWHTNSPPQNIAMHTVFRHLIHQEEIPATPQSPALTSSSASLHETLGVRRWVAAKDLPYTLSEKREEHVLLHFPLSKTDKICTQKKNSVTLDDFVKSVGFHCTHDCTAQDITH